jgi:hypothetical protein
MIDAGDAPPETLPFAERIAPVSASIEDADLAPLPPAVQAEMSRRWQSVLDGEPISEG